MRKQGSRKQSSKITRLPQIGRTTEQCAGVESKLNEFGVLGYRLLNITTNGHANQEANAVFDGTNYRWEYKVIQFSMRDPKVAEDQVNALGEDGWIFHQVYSQGANMFATALVLIRPNGVLPEPEPEEVRNENVEKIKQLEATIDKQISELKRYRERSKAGPEQTSDASETADDPTGTESHVTESELATVGAG